MRKKILLLAALTIFILAGCGKTEDEHLYEEGDIIASTGKEVTTNLLEDLFTSFRFSEYGGYELQLSCHTENDSIVGILNADYDCDTLYVKGDITKNDETVAIHNYVQDNGKEITLYEYKEDTNTWEEGPKKERTLIRIVNPEDIANSLIDAKMDAETSEKEYFVSGYIEYKWISGIFENNIAEICSLDIDTLEKIEWDVVLTFNKDTEELTSLIISLKPDTYNELIGNDIITELCMTILLKVQDEEIILDIPEL